MAPSGGGKQAANVKHLQSGSLALNDLRYALTHPVQEAKKVRSMKSVSFDKLRVYRLSSGLKSLLKVGALDRDTAVLAELSPVYEVAQTNGSNSPIAYLYQALANINVSNALNNVSVSTAPTSTSGSRSRTSSTATRSRSARSPGSSSTASGS